MVSEPPAQVLGNTTKSIFVSLDVHERKLVHMWAQLADDYNTITPAQRSAAKKEFTNLCIIEGGTFLDIKHKYNELLRKVTVQGGVINEVDRLETLLNALPEKCDILRESNFAQTPAPEIEYVWDRMYDIETTEMRRAAQSGASAWAGEVYYQSTRGRGSVRGRGRGNTGGGRGVV